MPVGQMSRIAKDLFAYNLKMDTLCHKDRLLSSFYAENISSRTGLVILAMPWKAK